jgi:Ca2+-binding EF-hand superfamily protein
MNKNKTISIFLVYFIWFNEKSYSQENLDAFRKAFDLIDFDWNKQFDKKKFQRFSNIIDLSDIYSAELFFIICDEKDNDLLSFDEFVSFLIKDLKCQNANQIFEKVFKKLGKDNSGTLDADELIEFAIICKILIDLEKLWTELKA